MATIDEEADTLPDRETARDRVIEAARRTVEALHGDLTGAMLEDALAALDAVERSSAELRAILEESEED